MAARRYPVDLDADLDSLRDNWSTELRYSATGTLSDQQVTKFYEQAESIFRNTIHAMVLDGLIDKVPR